jgi:hypothetical protein
MIIMGKPMSCSIVYMKVFSTCIRFMTLVPTGRNRQGMQLNPWPGGDDRSDGLEPWGGAAWPSDLAANSGSPSLIGFPKWPYWVLPSSESPA